MRSLLVGLYSGFLLSALRAPLGLELLQLPARDPHATMAFRGAALLAVALGLWTGMRRARADFSPTTLLAGVAAGFGAQWMYADLPAQLSVGLAFSVLLVLLVVSSQRGGSEARPDKSRIVFATLVALLGWGLLELDAPEGHSAAILTALLGGLAIALVGRITTRREPSPAANAAPAPGRAASFVLAGAGLAMMCEALARPVRQLGAGLATDDDVFATVFLGLATFGALAFGRLFAQRRARELGRGLLLVLAWVAALASLRVLENITTVRGLDRLVRHFGLDLSLHGMANYDVVVAAPVFVLPAFLVGTLVALCEKPVELASLCVGAAAGTVLVPGMLEYELLGTFAAHPEGGHSAALAIQGAALAALAVLPAALSKGALSSRPRSVLAVLGLASALLCWNWSDRVQRLEFSRPWENRPPVPTVFIDGPEGVLTLEDSPAGSLMASLNGHALAPPREAAAPDLERLRTSWSLLPEGVVDPKVLLVGQLTPERARTLLALGAASIDRSAAWYRAMPLLEARLFANEPIAPEGGAPEGEILDPRRARARLDAGDYDLVIVPPIGGELPTTRNLASPAETTVVCWFEGAGGAARLALGDEVLVSAPNLLELYVAVARGPGVEASRARREPGAPAWYAAGEPLAAIPALQTLRTREYARRQRELARLARRLADAELAPGLATGLALHFAAQKVDSPFDSWEVAVELDDEAVEAFAHAAAGEAPDALTIEVIEALARILRGKRRIDAIYPSLAGAAERHGPWPQLELALAQADLELLDPAGARTRLEALLETWPGNAEAWAMLAEAQAQVGDAAAAADSLEHALALAPGLHVLERRRAIALVRAGRPEGPAALEELLQEDPEDEELLQYRSSGPWRAPRPGYHPLVEHRDDH